MKKLKKQVAQKKTNHLITENQLVLFFNCSRPQSFLLNQINDSIPSYKEKRFESGSVITNDISFFLSKKREEMSKPMFIRLIKNKYVNQLKSEISKKDFKDPLSLLSEREKNRTRLHPFWPCESKLIPPAKQAKAVTREHLPHAMRLAREKMNGSYFHGNLLAISLRAKKLLHSILLTTKKQETLILVGGIYENHFLDSYKVIRLAQLIVDNKTQLLFLNLLNGSNLQMYSFLKIHSRVAVCCSDLVNQNKRLIAVLQSLRIVLNAKISN